MQNKISSSKILFYFCISFIVGIFIESIIKIPQLFLWVFLFAGVFLVFLLFAFREIAVIIGFCFLFFVLGILRMQISEFNILSNELGKFNGKGEVVLIGTISGEPDMRSVSQKLKVKVGDNTVLVTTNRYPEYKYLDSVKITGKLETPFETEDFSYKNYLLKDGIYSVMAFPKIEIIGKHNPNTAQKIYSAIMLIKEKLRESIQKNFSPPQSSILEGTILGDNGAMSNDLKDKLNITGLRHIIAVSGTHVIVLSSIIMSLLLALRLWRGQAFYATIALIFLYIILTGLPSSGVRAGIMGGTYLLSQKIGRQTMGPRLIVLACSIMLLVNPLLLFYDIGFQLSFVAVLGLIYLEPFINKFFKIFIKDKAPNFTSIISTTFAAQIFTLPVMVYNFGNISFVSPITNLLVLPIVYWLMIFGFLASIAGIFSGVLGWLLSIPCWILLTYFVKVIDVFSQTWAVKTFQNVHWFWLAVSYVIIIIVISFLNKKYSRKLYDF